MLKHDKGGANKEWNAFGVALNGWEMLGHVRGAFPLGLDVSLGGGWVPLGMSIWSGKASRAHPIDADSSTLCAIGRGIWSCALPIKSMPRHDEFDWTGTREVRVTLPDDTDVSLTTSAWEVYRGHPGKVSGGFNVDNHEAEEDGIRDFGVVVFCCLTVGRAQVPEVTIRKIPPDGPCCVTAKPTLCWVRGQGQLRVASVFRRQFHSALEHQQIGPFGFCACPRDVGHAGVVLEA